MSIDGGNVALEARALASSVAGLLRRARVRWLRASAAAALFLVAGLAAAALWAVTSRFGIGVENDGVIYLAGARNWLCGDGISWISGGGEAKPIVHFPPLMSLLLAGLSLLSFDLLEAGRLLNVAAFGLNGLLIGLCLWRITRSALAGLAGEMLFLVTPAIVTIHSYALTDGPFLTFALVAAILMGEYFERRSMAALTAAGMAAGLAYLLRYVGVALVVALAATLLVHRGIPRKERLLATAVFLAPALLPVSVWFLRNITRTGRLSSFQLLFHGDYAAGFADGYRLMMDWFVPGRETSRAPVCSIPSRRGCTCWATSRTGPFMAQPVPRPTEPRGDDRPSRTRLWSVGGRGSGGGWRWMWTTGPCWTRFA